MYFASAISRIDSLNVVLREHSTEELKLVKHSITYKLNI